MTEGSTRHRTCRIADRLVRARGLLRLARFKPSSPAAAELRQHEVMRDTRCTEPSLDELLGDAAIQLLMRRDGVSESDVRALVGELRGARAATLGETAPKNDASTSAARLFEREKSVPGGRRPAAGTLPIGFM